MKDYYEVIGVGSNAEHSQIREAFIARAKLYHPDVNDGSEEAERKFKKLIEAYEVLSDETSRKTYDQTRQQEFAKSGYTTPSRTDWKSFWYEESDENARGSLRFALFFMITGLFLPILGMVVGLLGALMFITSSDDQAMVSAIFLVKGSLVCGVFLLSNAFLFFSRTGKGLELNLKEIFAIGVIAALVFQQIIFY